MASPSRFSWSWAMAYSSPLAMIELESDTSAFARCTAEIGNIVRGKRVCCAVWQYSSIVRRKTHSTAQRVVDSSKLYKVFVTRFKPSKRKHPVEKYDVDLLDVYRN
ncbi:hypothetical protein MPTK1_3g22650 [Marchantia polymorpha subsp. ruderalis]|uniref:Uncharacterized protein n=2 Tax=Marchantia polymorpha TaxID=3197 RepID=A0AAF6B3P1_MARPO|nr:hypothetical protein MARPO_0024s0043 [Marchantia polymorpha]BBN06625.1 hypothetical protein Mp_3g22650 [Marchantia polymorpha subsp. ruderalis]|eukprot:PTQ43525.1 hypothetical protein MARPO_0024s0043 [Marchantia polymorpha]